MVDVILAYRGTIVVVRFTSVPEAARMFLDAVRGYAHHVIKRAEHI